MKSTVLLLAALLPIASLADDGRYIVKFRDTAKGRAALFDNGGEVVRELGPQNAAAARIPAARVEALRNHPAVEYIEEDAKRYPLAQSTPYGIPMVQADLLFSTTNGAARKVCVIDSGFYTGHEDLQDGSVNGYPAGWDSDTCGHGSHVAGTIAALNNTVGVVGVFPNGVNLHIIKVFDGADCGWSYSSDLVDALNRCVDAGANVVNMSLGGGRAMKTEQNAFDSAYSKGVLSIAAAGNDGTTAKSYPASYSSVVSVAAIDSTKTVADFSQKNDAVELAAPGVAVNSTLPFREDVSLTVDGVTYQANHIDNAARTDGVSGALANGGLCDTTNGAWSGKVVLCERGSISFFDKTMNVQNSGGVAAVIYNNASGNFFGTLGDGNSSTIPSVSLSQEDGQYLVNNKLGVSGTVLDQLYQPASGYAEYNGTSMATPHVAGVAAAVWSHNTGWTNAQIREALQKTAEDLGAAGKDNSYGYGLIQAKAALDYLNATYGGGGGGGGGGGETDTTAPVISNVASAKLNAKRGTFEITWTTDEASNSEVTFTCCGVYTDANMVTSHQMSFSGTKGATYEYYVSSTDAAGNKATAGPFIHQN